MFAYLSLRRSKMIFTLCTAGLVVAACARSEIRLHAVSYNKAISDYGNKQVLLNAVRASKRFPMYFSKVGDMTGNGMLSGSVQTQFPFRVEDGSHVVLPNFNINPQASADSGLSSVKIGNLNTKEFQKGLFTEITPELFQIYHENSWTRQVLFTMFIHKISVSYNMNNRIQSSYYQKCMNDDFYKPLCRQISNDVGHYKATCSGKLIGLRYFNTGKDRCDYLKFQIFLRKIWVLNPRFEKDTRGTKSKMANAGKMQASAMGGSERILFKGLNFEAKKVTQTTHDGEVVKSVVYAEPKKVPAAPLVLKIKLDTEEVTFANANDPANSARRDELKVDLRSPHAMIKYVGELINAQLHVEDRFVPEIVVGPEAMPVPLFEIRRSPIGKIISGAVSVKHEARTYYVPRPRYGKQVEARSLQVLDLINQVIIHQTTQEDLPKTSTVQLISSN